MKFWRKYKAKRELERKLNKARFVNFYGVFEIDFSLGEIKEIREFIVSTQPLNSLLNGFECFTI